MQVEKSRNTGQSVLPDIKEGFCLFVFKRLVVSNAAESYGEDWEGLAGFYSGKVIVGTKSVVDGGQTAVS